MSNVAFFSNKLYYVLRIYKMRQMKCDEWSVSLFAYIGGIDTFVSKLSRNDPCNNFLKLFVSMCLTIKKHEIVHMYQCMFNYEKKIPMTNMVRFGFHTYRNVQLLIVRVFCYGYNNRN